MAAPRGYNSYHGGRTPVGKIFLTILLILIILGAAAVILLQKYVVYDDTGKPHLDLPAIWTTNEAGTASSAGGASSSAADVKITIEKPEKNDAALAGVQLSADPAAWQATVDACEPLGQNAFAVTMKTAGGRLQYDSKVPGTFLAPTADTASAALSGILTAEHYSIARISCFHDGLYASANLETAGLKNTGGYIFYDGDNTQWLDPSKQGTADYLCAIVKECADLGFHEILLTDFTYPTVGKLNKIDYGYAGDGGDTGLAAYQAAQLEKVLSALEETLKPYDVKLSIEVPAALIADGRETGGLVLKNIAARVDRVYAVTAPGDDTAPLLQAVTAQNAAASFIPELSEAPQSGDYLLLPKT